MLSNNSSEYGCYYPEVEVGCFSGSIIGNQLKIRSISTDSLPEAPAELHGSHSHASKSY